MESASQCISCGWWTYNYQREKIFCNNLKWWRTALIDIQENDTSKYTKIHQIHQMFPFLSCKFLYLGALIYFISICQWMTWQTDQETRIQGRQWSYLWRHRASRRPPIHDTAIDKDHLYHNGVIQLNPPWKRGRLILQYRRIPADIESRIPVDRRIALPFMLTDSWTPMPLTNIVSFPVSLCNSTGLQWQSQLV